MRRFTKRWRFSEEQELEIVERASRSQDGAPLVYEHERSSGGLMKRHEERFPSRDTSEPKARPEMQRVLLLDAGGRHLFFCHDYAEAKAMEQHGNHCVWRGKRQRFSPGMCRRYRNAVLVGGHELSSANNPRGSFPQKAARVQ